MRLNYFYRFLGISFGVCFTRTLLKSVGEIIYNSPSGLMDKAFPS